LHNNYRRAKKSAEHRRGKEPLLKEEQFQKLKEELKERPADDCYHLFKTRFSMKPLARRKWVMLLLSLLSIG
jgi:hypothetical protein